MVLLYLAKNAGELAYAEELERTGARVIARLADGSVPPAFMQDAGAARIDGASLKELVPDIAGREVYVSGSPASVRSLRAAARRARGPPDPCGLLLRVRAERVDFPLEPPFLLSSRTSRR